MSVANWLVMAERPDKGGTVVLPVAERKPKLERARKYAIVFYNDDYTMKWFVVDVLERLFHFTEASAMALMLAIHKERDAASPASSRETSPRPRQPW